jgi:DNA-binding response OmpR family regulator
MPMQRILVVDDEVDVLELVTYNLRRAGYEVSLATNGLDAIDLARSQRPDLIILDLMLPEVHGFDVCDVLRKDPTTANIPIIMLTAWASDSARVLGLEVGADDYITKPFSPRELVLRVNKLVHRGDALAKN